MARHGETRERIFRFVRERLLAGRPPTVREVQQAAGLRAVESARVHLEHLVAEGRLAKDPGLARGYRLPDTAEGGLRPALVPLLGRVQAGGLTAAIEEPDGHVAVAGAPAGDAAETLLALRVAGDSMRDAGILDGDVVIVRRDLPARDGDVVVALVGDEATVKTLRLVAERHGRRTRRHVELHPANPAFAPIVPDAAALEIVGRVVEVRRSLV